MDSKQHDSSRTTLASCSMCHVEHCADCDVVHVHVGHTSLRLTTSGFLALCATLLEAARNIEQPSAARRASTTARTGLQ